MYRLQQIFIHGFDVVPLSYSVGKKPGNKTCKRNIGEATFVEERVEAKLPKVTIKKMTIIHQS